LQISSISKISLIWSYPPPVDQFSWLYAKCTLISPNTYFSGKIYSQQQIICGLVGFNFLICCSLGEKLEKSRALAFAPTLFCPGARAIIKTVATHSRRSIWFSPISQTEIKIRIFANKKEKKKDFEFRLFALETQIMGGKKSKLSKKKIEDLSIKTKCKFSLFYKNLL